MKLVRLLCLMLFAVQAQAGESPIYQQSVHKPVAEVYDAVYGALESAKFFVVFEANIGKNLAGFADKWGAEYNKNSLTAIRSMVFCNGWYANQVSNLDPTMLALCPLHLTIIEQAGSTTVLFNRPSLVAAGSAAQPVLLEVENKVIAAIRQALQP
jgi:uncharacterized protein (DUF302 family)